MKKILAMVVLLGLSGGAYAGSALEQLGTAGGAKAALNKEVSVAAVPVASAKEVASEYLKSGQDEISRDEVKEIVGRAARVFGPFPGDIETYKFDRFPIQDFQQRSIFVNRIIHAMREKGHPTKLSEYDLDEMFSFIALIDFVDANSAVGKLAGKSAASKSSAYSDYRSCVRQKVRSLFYAGADISDESIGATTIAEVVGHAQDAYQILTVGVESCADVKIPGYILRRGELEIDNLARYGYNTMIIMEGPRNY